MKIKLLVSACIFALVQSISQASTFEIKSEISTVTFGDDVTYIWYANSVEHHIKAKRKQFQKKISRPDSYLSYKIETKPSDAIKNATFVNYPLKFYQHPQTMYGSDLSKTILFENNLLEQKVEAYSQLDTRVSVTQYDGQESDTNYEWTRFGGFDFRGKIRGSYQDYIDTVSTVIEAERKLFFSYIDRPKSYIPYEIKILSYPTLAPGSSKIFHINNVKSPVRTYRGNNLTKTIMFENTLAKHQLWLLHKAGIKAEIVQSKLLTQLVKDLNTINSENISKLTSVTAQKAAIDNYRHFKNGKPLPKVKRKNIVSKAQSCADKHNVKSIKDKDKAKKEAESLLNCIVGKDVITKANKIEPFISESSKSYQCIKNSANKKAAVSCLDGKLGGDVAKVAEVGKCFKYGEYEMDLYCLVNKNLSDSDKQSLKQIDCFADASTTEKKAKCLLPGLDKDAQALVDMKDCINKAASNVDKFACAAEGRLGKNEAEALKLAQCLSKAKSNFERVNCAADGRIGKNEQEALRLANCAAGSSSYVGMAACAAGADITFEQQIFLDCATSASAGPQAYGACVGGRLAAKELEKCFDKGIGSEDCFGENNFFRQSIENIRRETCNAVGNDLAVCSALSFVVDNAIMPGKNHEIVKYFDTALFDIKNGPGPNNEFRKAGKIIEDIVNNPGGKIQEGLKELDNKLTETKDNIEKTTAKAEKDARNTVNKAVKDTRQFSEDTYNTAKAGAKNIVDGLNNAKKGVEKKVNEFKDNVENEVNRTGERLKKAAPTIKTDKPQVTIGGTTWKL